MRLARGGRRNATLRAAFRQERGEIPQRLTQWSVITQCDAPCRPRLRRAFQTLADRRFILTPALAQA